MVKKRQYTLQKSFLQRLYEKIKEDENGCWVWQGAKIGQYGTTSLRKKKILAHRAMYSLLVGPIPEGLDLDHLCRNRSCINPVHLEPVTRSINLRRGIEATGCKNGHSIENFSVLNRKNGKFERRCIICHRERNKKCSK